MITPSVLDIKMFKLYRSEEMFEDANLSQSAAMSNPDGAEYFSLNKLLTMTNAFSGQIFQMVYKGKEIEMFKFV